MSNSIICRMLIKNMLQTMFKCYKKNGGVIIWNKITWRNILFNLTIKNTRCFVNTSAKYSTRINATSNPFNKKKSQQISVFGWILLLIPVSTFALGCWQIQRKKWKENLIETIKVQMMLGPVSIPEDITKLNSMEYQAIKVRGQFIHDNELYLGPRSLINIGKSESRDSSSGLITTSKPIGFHVITPFKLENSDHIILINRGWVSKNHVNKKTRMNGQISDMVELVGIVRKADKRPPFSPIPSTNDRYDLSSPISNYTHTLKLLNNPSISNSDKTLTAKQTPKESCEDSKLRLSKNHFIFRDIPRMCTITGAQPYFLDATIESTVAGGPIGGQTQIFLHNQHFSYIITWYSLSALTSYIWYRRIFKRA